MENVISTLPERVSPDAMAAGAPSALKTGHVSCASDLLAIYSSDEVDNTKMSTLTRIALVEGLTCNEFASECKKAQELADIQDKATGFVKTTGAKGADAYGPIRRVLNQRLSEAKQIFGVLKRAPELLKEKGYVSALNISRLHLRDAGLKWDGTRALSEEDKAKQQRGQQQQAAVLAALQQVPREEGESLTQWMERAEDVIDNEQAKLENEVFNQGVEKAHKAFLKTHGESVLHAMLQMVIDGMATDKLEQLQQYIQEELVIRTLEKTQSAPF